MNWTNFWHKVGRIVGQRQGYLERYKEGYEKGVQMGRTEAQVFANMLTEYGGFDQIPTDLLRELPTMGDEMASRQTLKRAFFVLRALVEELEMPPVDNLGDALADYLESDPKQPEALTEKIERVQHNPSVFGGLVSLASDLDSLDVELFMTLVRKDPQTLKLYYNCLKNENHYVK